MRRTSLDLVLEGLVGLHRTVQLCLQHYWMLGAGALGRPRVMVWGGRREEAGGFRMGNMCIPVVDSC